MLESIYYIFAGPVLVVVGIIALRQISVLREQTRQSEMQHLKVLEVESDRRAIDLSDRYVTQVLPELQRMMRRIPQLQRGEWAQMLEDDAVFDWDALVRDGSARTRFAMDMSVQAANGGCHEILNQLEFIALQLNRGVASDSLGEALMHDSLLEAIKLLAPYIAKIRVASPSAYGELIALYQRWSESEIASTCARLTSASS